MLASDPCFNIWYRTLTTRYVITTFARDDYYIGLLYTLLGTSIELTFMSYRLQLLIPPVPWKRPCNALKLS